MATRTLPYVSATASAPRPVIGRAWTALCMMVRARKTRSLLAEMEPRMLADIGASRSDAQIEAARPFWDMAAKRRS